MFVQLSLSPSGKAGALMPRRSSTTSRRKNSGGAWRPVRGTLNPTGTTISSTKNTPVPKPTGFKEHKSNVKTIMPRRVAQEETQKEKIKKVEEERAKVKEMHDEEVFRAADRNVDLVYHSFKDDFTRMQKSITEGLTFCLTKSKGKMAPQVSELQRQNDMICQSIAYTHKQGIGNELENSKRQEAYIEYKKQMEQIVSRVAHLVGMAQQYY